jgi:hypothetical protein
MQYTTVEITYKGKPAVFSIFDYCADKDCSSCCTKNRKKGGLGMLFDLDSSAVQRIWGISNAEANFSTTGTYRMGQKFDEKAIAAKYGAKWDG